MEPTAGTLSLIDPPTVAPSWALSSFDWLAHAVDAWADHPVGVWVARCGHQLSGITPLSDMPQGKRCAGCDRWSQVTASWTLTGSGR
jgi:hypothetical protein